MISFVKERVLDKYAPSLPTIHIVKNYSKIQKVGHFENTVVIDLEIPTEIKIKFPNKLSKKERDLIMKLKEEGI